MKRFALMLSVLSIAVFTFISGCGGGGSSAVTATGVSNNTAAARVSSISPSDGADNVATDSAVTVEFTGQMHMQSVNDNFHVYQGMSSTGTEVMGTVSWNDMQTMMTFTPTNPMAGNATHSVHFGTGMMSNGGGMMMNMSGQTMTQEMYMYFATE